MKDMKAMARPFLALYAMALVIALLGRIGLAVAGGTGVLAFDYISASGVPASDLASARTSGTRTPSMRAGSTFGTRRMWKAR